MISGDVIHPAIAFHVAHSVTMTFGSTIPFNTVKANIGNGWNNSTHTFTAPIKGLYYFSLSVMTGWQTARADAKIVQGSNVPLRNVVTHKGHRDGHIPATGSAVIILNKGEQIHAKRNRGTLYSNGNLEGTHFVGFLIMKVK